MTHLKDSQIKSPYNEEEVYYCKDCLSLSIQIIGKPEDNDSVCTKCNRTDIEKTDIFTWREMWKDKYGEYPDEPKKVKHY